ncbi:MAG: DUF502 domain-containing protein [Bacteroidetes bacterium]|nr:DUF502 domain-containing protein [Bacteroidota bacterium]
MKKFVGYFLQGILFIVPIAVTVYLLYLTFEFIDGILPPEIIGVRIPGLSALIIVFSITIIGFLGKILVSQPIFQFVNKLINKLPLIKVIYCSIKDLLSAFVGKEKKFTHPVLIKLNKNLEIERLGFITQNDLKFLGIENKKIAVYLPSSYGILGDLYIVPVENVTQINANSIDVMKFIVSGGVSKF